MVDYFLSLLEEEGEDEDVSLAFHEDEYGAMSLEKRSPGEEMLYSLAHGGALAAALSLAKVAEQRHGDDEAVVSAFEKSLYQGEDADDGARAVSSLDVGKNWSIFELLDRETVSLSAGKKDVWPLSSMEQKARYASLYAEEKQGNTVVQVAASGDTPSSGTGLGSIDRAFRRDARAYDSGFTLY